MLPLTTINAQYWSAKSTVALKFLPKVYRVLYNNVSDLYAIPWGWSGVWLQPWWWRGQQDWRGWGGRGKEENKGTYIPHLEDCYTIIVSGLLMWCVPRALNNWRHNLQFSGCLGAYSGVLFGICYISPLIYGTWALALHGHCRRFDMLAFNPDSLAVLLLILCLLVIEL